MKDGFVFGCSRFVLLSFSVSPKNWQVAREKRVWAVRTERLLLYTSLPHP
ncbi:MAG: hypothetical protein QXR42_09265 [Candidatus Bathyarchaeia archaeon]